MFSHHLRKFYLEEIFHNFLLCSLITLNKHKYANVLYINIILPLYRREKRKKKHSFNLSVAIKIQPQFSKMWNKKWFSTLSKTKS